MEIWQAIIVGIVQGLAEFLPISSSGHIVLTQYLLGMREVGATHQPDLSFEIILHIGTLASVLIFFRESLWNLCKSLWTKNMQEERKMIIWLALASVPAAVAFKLWKKHFQDAYSNPFLVSALLLLTAALLFVPKLIKGKTSPIGAKSSVLMGIGQALAILPGVSRSGSTIAVGLLSGVKAEKAAEFSFLMSIPAILGGFFFNLKDQAEVSGSYSTALQACFSNAYIAGAIAAGVVGLFAIYVVMDVVKKGKLEYFSYYLIIAGIAGMIYWS